MLGERERNAICRIEVTVGGEIVTTGTGVLVEGVGKAFVLTAMHVVTDKSASLPDALTLRFLGGPVVSGRVAMDASGPLWSVRDDWALVELLEPLPEVPPLRTRIADGTLPFDTAGFPDSNPAGKVLSGNYTELRHRPDFGNASVPEAEQRRQHELGCTLATGLLLSGISGGSCIVEGEVTGVVVSVLESGERVVGGTLYATPIEVVVDGARGALAPAPAHDKNVAPNIARPEWFSGHLDAALLRAGPRYNPSLHHGHALDDTFAALGDTDAWRERRRAWCQRISRLVASWGEAVAAKDDSKGLIEPFPSRASVAGAELLSSLKAIVDSFDGQGSLVSALALTRAAQESAARSERELATDIDARFGSGAANSTTFRQHQAEYQCCFPARHLDECREIQAVIADIAKWLEAPAIRASTERVLLLTGPAGIGKTHGLCDVAVQRRNIGLPTILVSGAQFSSDRSVWECLTAALSLDSSWSKDVLLDALDAAGAAAGRLLVCIDALDERTRRTRWLDDLPEVVQAVTRRPNLGLCIAVRDGYQKQVLRDDLDLPTFIHPGFGDAVFDACAVFFSHFGLEPPVGPLLEPEFSNPLFLLVLCRTLETRGLTSVPAGWRGTRRVLGRLLATRDDEVRQQAPGVGNRAISNAMEALAEAIPDGGTLGWSEADKIVVCSLPLSQQGRVELLDHLVGLGLLRVVPGEDDEWVNEEDRVDIAFGRLRHHLIADRLTATPTSNERLRLAALDDPGLAESLSLILPERERGELVDLASDRDERRQLMDAWVASLPWREDATLGASVEALLMDALREPALEHRVLDAMVTLALRPGHSYDHRYFYAFLARIPLPRRDARLCWYLHRAFEQASPPSPVVRALRAPWEADPSRVERTLREAWCVVLGWCGAAADQRVRDHATKAAVRLTEPDPGVWSSVVTLFADVDDDSVLERVLCAAYGAVLRNPDASALSDLARTVRDRILRRSPAPPAHALIRGQAQMIGEWAAYRGVLPSDVVVADFRPPHAGPSEIRVPPEDDLKQYDDQKNYPQLYSSVMSAWTGDFAEYTMPFALGEYESLLGKEATRRWVLGTVVELGYEPKLHAPYDHEMLVAYGPGRGRPGWAERIGKKYQRIALGRLVGLLDDIAHAQGNPVSGLACEQLRDLDPSLLQREAAESDEAESAERWWVPVAMDFAASASITDAAWVGADDFPNPAALVCALIDPARPNQSWRLLDGYFSWDDRSPNRERRRYRDAWMMIKGYLVPRVRLSECWEALGNADFMGRWMVEGFDQEGRVYVGEYPWAPPFPELRESAEAWQDEAKQFAQFDLRPTANVVIRTGDSWQEGTVRITVPSAELVAVTATRWDGTAGFRREDGSLVFQDPSVTAGGPGGLWIDDGALAELQETLDVGLIWTVLAERRIIGDTRANFCGMKHVSFTMWLDGRQVQARRGPGEHLRPDHIRRPA